MKAADDQRLGATQDLGADRFVLRGRQLRDGADLSSTSRFNEDVWSLTPAILLEHNTSRTIYFATIQPRDRPALKMVLDTMLSGELPAGELPCTPNSIYTHFAQIRRFLNWLQQHRDRIEQPLPIHEITANDLAGYPVHLKAAGASVGAQRMALYAPRYLWRYRTVLDGLGLTVDPATVPGWSLPHAYRAENLTDRIPETVLGPLIGWAARFVEDFSPDILTAHQSWLNRRATHRPAGRLAEPEGITAFNKMMNDYLAANRPLPGRNGKVNDYFLATTIGCRRSVIDRYRRTVDAVAAKVGVSDRTDYWIDITGRIDGSPWIAAINTDFRAADGLATVGRMLQAACYILIAYLSGMRDSEVKHLQRQCLRTQLDADGHPYRWTVTSLAFKGESNPAGATATWMIGRLAARAVDILHKLQSPDAAYLFAPLPHSQGNGPANRSQNSALTSATTNRQLNNFVVWINNYGREHGRSDGIPALDGRDVPIATRQFRRTLAWFVARQPGGSIAGAIQYRHLSIQMFEGYAGTSDSGFRAEVEAEQALTRGEYFAAAINDHHHETFSGPAAAEARQRLELFADRTRYAGQTITDRHRLARLVSKHDPAIYPGKYATCVFNPDRALCQPKPGTTAPLIGNCKPLDCKNVALDAANIAALHSEIQTLDEHLAARPTLPPLLHARLRSRREEIAVFLRRNTSDQP